MSRLTSKKLYSGIDLFKLIASILVVLLHAIETTDFIAKEVQFVLDGKNIGIIGKVHPNITKKPNPRKRKR